MQCPKCGGLGYIACYGHIAHGVCFRCNGHGVVASNGKPIKSVKTTQLKYTLYGLNKRETKQVLDCVLSGASYSVRPDQLTQKDVIVLEKMVMLGHMDRFDSVIWVDGREYKHMTYKPAQWFTRKSIDILIDWSK